MLKLRTYLYSKRGEFLSSKQLSKASWVRLTNKSLDIDRYDFFPPNLKVSEKLEHIKYLKLELNKENFQEIEQENSIFEIKDGWEYVTFDKKGNEIFKPINKKSKYFSLFKNYELKISDYFPDRLSPEQKINYLKNIINDFLTEEEALKKLEEEEFRTEKRYYSKKIEKSVTSYNMVIRFPFNPSWSIFKDELEKRIKEKATEARSDLLKIGNPNKFHMWQFIACLVPIDGNGEVTHEHKQYISTHQLSNYKHVYDEMIEQIDSLNGAFEENYKIDFEQAEIGFREFTLCLIQ